MSAIDRGFMGNNTVPTAGDRILRNERAFNRELRNRKTNIILSIAWYRVERKLLYAYRKKKKKRFNHLWTDRARSRGSPAVDGHPRKRRIAFYRD